MSSTDGNVIEHENYPTPEAAVRALLNKIDFKADDSFFEPCCGDLSDADGNELPCIFNLVPLDIMQKEWAEIRMGREFLTTDYGCRKFDVIITNPPFSLSTEFLRKCKSLLAPGGTLIFLQRVNWLGSKKRVRFWQEVGMPSKSPILVPRPKFDKSKKGTDSCEYAWYIYDNGDRTRNIPFGLSHSIAEGYKID
ncbi:MAG: DNA methyltransferase [Aeromonas popoffii]|uniref:DNA methyltransferase n=1 Tax=Aeromonas popoffii TaxID=70856 RepID=UPI003F333B8D